MSFNLSAWALQNRQIVLYLMILLGAVGALSYSKLGQSEDPPFTFKAMVVQTKWPGASAEEVARQVTERIEKKLMETGDYDRIVSFSRPGVSQVTFMAREDIHSSEIPELWYQIRKKISDIRATLPQSIQGPFFNDEFGTTYGNIYALTGKGFDYAVMKDYADRLQLQLQRIRNVGKVELIGLQDEKIWIDLSNTKLATLGLPLAAVQKALEEQNAVASSGFFETASDRVQLRVSGRFDSVEEIRDFPIRVGDRTFRIGDVAEVRRGFNDPPAPRMRFMGEDAIGLAVAMKPGGDILVLGKALETEFARLQQSLPAGLELRKVSDQPAAVRTGVGEFIRVLAEALVIVLLVSFFSLGLRTGLVVALSIPLVLAMTFAAMHYFGIGLHKISLGALVLALGLLVDDAIIAVEMMAVKMEQGYDRLKAASFAWTSTAFRHPDHRRRLPADRHRAVRHRRIHPLVVPGGDHRPGGLLVRRGGLRSLPGGQAAAGPGQVARAEARRQRRWLRSLCYGLLPALPASGGVVRALPQDGDRPDSRGLRRRAAAVPPGAAAVLPALGAPGAAAGHQAGGGRLTALYRRGSPAPGKNAAGP